MIPFDPDASFEKNVQEALTHVSDRQLAEILRNNISVFLHMSRENSGTIRQPILNELVALINERVKGEAK